MEREREFSIAGPVGGREDWYHGCLVTGVPIAYRRAVRGQENLQKQFLQGESVYRQGSRTSPVPYRA